MRQPNGPELNICCGKALNTDFQLALYWIAHSIQCIPEPVHIIPAAIQRWIQSLNIM